MHRLAASGPPLGGLDAIVQMLSTDDTDPPSGRPWVSTDMVMSLDGAYSSDGTSGGLSSDADHALFIAHRSTADAILVGASTVREEGYRRPTVSEEAAERRRVRSQSALPLLVVVSSSLDLGANTPLLHGDPPAPIIAHPARSDTSNAPEGLELIQAGETTVDLALLLSELAGRGVRRVACEGGPGLLGQLAKDDLIDEFLVTISPQLVGGTSVGLLGGVGLPGGVGTGNLPFELHAVLRDGDHLMCSYRRARDAAR